MDENKVKEAFQKAKEDIVDLKNQIISLSEEIKELKRTLQQTDRQTDTQAVRQTLNSITQTHSPTIQTDEIAHISKESLEGLKTKNFNVSIGNDGVQTDRQTDTQTDRHMQKFALTKETKDPLTRIAKVAEVVNSLDALKKDLRKQFKQLTPQEMLVFSTIYQLTNEKFDVDYALLSKKTNLSESSIRDYIQKLIKKGVPLEKTKENNKRINLTIPPEFKRIASLETLISLRSI